MAGIVSYGVYIPFYRLNRSEISGFWGGPPLPGEKAVAGYDEDAVTMAVEACRNCLSGLNPGDVNNFYLASTTFPYCEKQSAALVAAAADMGRDALTVDLSGSLRSGISGVRMAADSVKAGSAGNALVCASDARLGLPNGPRELEFGDGAAALLVGETGVVATIDNVYSVNHEIFDVFRSAEETCVRSWEDRYVREMGYTRVIVGAVTEALKRFNMTAGDFARAVISAPNPVYLGAAAKKLGFDAKTQLQDLMYGTIGNAGTAHPLIMLAAALEEAKPGDKILWAGYGDGCDVMVLTVTGEITRLQARKGFKRQLLSRGPDLNYRKYLKWRGIIPTEPPMRPRTEPVSAAALWRDSRCGLALYGVKCRQCGTVQYPVQRICMECRAKDDFEYHPFAGKQGKVATFSHDNLAVSPDPPSTVAAIDFDGGGRIMMDITDRNPEEVRVGMPVEVTFRRFRQVEGVNVYWWKCRPPRQSME